MRKLIIKKTHIIKTSAIILALIVCLNVGAIPAQAGVSIPTQAGVSIPAQTVASIPVQAVVLSQINKPDAALAKSAEISRINTSDAAPAKSAEISQINMLDAAPAGSAEKVISGDNQFEQFLTSHRIFPSLQSASIIPYKACPSKCGPLKVTGTRLTDSKGRKVQLRGVSTHGIAWFPQYVNQKLFKELKKKWNANVVRLAMYTDEYGGYCSGGDQKQLKNLIKQGVEFAAKADMYVIIDWHVLNDQNPNKYKKQAKKFFRSISKSLASYDNILYEICNEPNGGTTWKNIKKYAKAVIPVIRKNDKDAVIIVGTPTWSQDVDQAAADPITGYSNIMYSLHFYAATHKEDLRNKMVAAVKAGLPVFVTEYGICDASGNGAVDKTSAKKWIKAMNKYGISYVCWNLSNKDETSALIKSSCSKTSGFANKDLSAEGKWLKKILKSKGMSK